MRSTRAEGRQGKAESGDFSSGSAASVSETVVIYDTAQDVGASLDQFNDRSQCVIAAVNNGDVDSDAATYSDASLSPLSFPKYGDRSESYRFKLHVKAKDQTGFGSEGDAYIDMIYILNGRVGFSIVAFDVFSPFDTTDLQRIVVKAQAKVKSCENCTP